MMTMRKNVLTAFITMIYATSGVMAADDNVTTDGLITFNGEVIAPACTLVAATKDSVVTLPDVSATKLQISGQVFSMQIDVSIELRGCGTIVTKNATFTFNGTADTTQITTFADQASSDVAINVALQMYMNDGATAITPDAETGSILLQDGDQALAFKIGYIATGKVTSGNVDVVTDFYISYY